MIRHQGGDVRQDVLVAEGLPEQWDDELERAFQRTGDPAPASLRYRWVTLAAGRIPGQLLSVTLWDEGRLAVGMVGGVVREPGEHPRFDPYTILSGASVPAGIAVQGPHPWHDRQPTDVLPCCLLMFPNYETAPAGDEARDPVAVQSFVDGVVRWADSARMRSIALLYLRADYPEFVEALRHSGFAVTPMTEQHLLTVTWSDFDGYLHTFAPKRRRTIQREYRGVSGRGVSIVERPLGDDEPELVRLRCNLVSKYGAVPSEDGERTVLAHLRGHFGADDLLVIEARIGNKLVNFSLFVRDTRQWTALMTGTDYDEPAGRLAYFATMYYRPAELAPSLGVRSINYGMGAGEAKRLRGCEARRLLAACLLR